MSAARFGHLAHEDLADLRAVAVDRGHQDVARLVVAQLHDQLGEVGLDRRDALALEVLVEADLLGGHGLDLDDLVGPGGADQVGDDAVGLVGVARPVHDAAAGDDVGLELFEQLRQPRHHVLLEGAAGQPELFPVLAFAHDSKAFGADGAGRVADVAAHLGVGERPAGARGKGFGAAEVAVAGYAEERRHRGHRHRFGRGEDLREVHCANAGADPAQATADVHQARRVACAAHLGAGLDDVGHLVGKHRGGGVGVLDRERATEAAAGIRRRQFDERHAAHVAQQFQRLVADAQHAQRVAGGVVGDAVRVVGADVAHVEHVDEELREFVGARCDRLGAARQVLVAGAARDHRVLVAHRPDARPRRGDGIVAAGVLEHLDVVADEVGGLDEVAGVDVHLAAAGLLRREDHLVTEALEQRHGGDGGLRKHRVRKTGGEQGYAHGAPKLPTFMDRPLGCGATTVRHCGATTPVMSLLDDLVVKWRCDTP